MAALLVNRDDQDRATMTPGVIDAAQVLPWYIFALWGLLGGVITDGLEIWHDVKKRGPLAPLYRTKAFALAEGIRLGAGVALAVAFAQADQISGCLGALVIGAATPLIMEKLSRQLPVLPLQP